MNTTKKLTIAVVALALSLVLLVGGTLAFLVAESNVVTNTFTYGGISLKLWEENKTNESGMNFSVVPGDELDKDPVITVVEGSEECYVYVLIDNQLGTAATYNIDATVDWIEVGESGTKVLYRYKEVVDAKSEAKDLTVFTKLKFSENLVKADVDGLANKNVVISAYAHQADNTDVDAANATAIIWAEVTVAN